MKKILDEDFINEFYFKRNSSFLNKIQEKMKISKFYLLEELLYLYLYIFEFKFKPKKSIL